MNIFILLVWGIIPHWQEYQGILSWHNVIIKPFQCSRTSIVWWQPDVSTCHVNCDVNYLCCWTLLLLPWVVLPLYINGDFTLSDLWLAGIKATSNWYIVAEKGRVNQSIERNGKPYKRKPYFYKIRSMLKISCFCTIKWNKQKCWPWVFLFLFPLRWVIFHSMIRWLPLLQYW